jgi:hypothetical protein
MIEKIKDIIYYCNVGRVAFEEFGLKTKELDHQTRVGMAVLTRACRREKWSYESAALMMVSTIHTAFLDLVEEASEGEPIWPTMDCWYNSFSESMWIARRLRESRRINDEAWSEALVSFDRYEESKERFTGEKSDSRELFQDMLRLIRYI